MRKGEKAAVASVGATPNCWKVPPRRTRDSPSSMAAGAPVQSMTTSHPSVAPHVVGGRRHRRDADPPGAVSSRSGSRSTTVTEAAPARGASWAIISPIVPAP